MEVMLPKSQNTSWIPLYRSRLLRGRLIRGGRYLFLRNQLRTLRTIGPNVSARMVFPMA